MNKHRKDVVDDDNDDDVNSNDDDDEDDDDVAVAVGQEQTPGFSGEKNHSRRELQKKQAKVGDILA